MQNNVTELTQKLLRALDSNYNVNDMPAVIEVISLLEKVSITKELLETTRLGKHVNELRRRATDEGLSKRAKELVKKWRNMVWPDSNGQIKSQPQEDVNLNQLKSKKRPAKDVIENYNAKRAKVNGGVSELDFSDNSNSSFKDMLGMNAKQEKSAGSGGGSIIIVNSDSNSSMPEKMDPHLDQQMPKKRGRKKGSKNHKNLLDEAESSFTNKLAVSRGNSKVKTTQELIASLQNKSNTSGTNVSNTLPAVKSKEDLNEKAAKLTERVSIIDQKLNPTANRYKNNQKQKVIGNVGNAGIVSKSERVLESGSVINDRSAFNNSSADEDQIIIVDDVEPETDSLDKADVKDEEKPQENHETEIKAETDAPRSLSIDECLALMPPIDKSCLLEDESEDRVVCTCLLKENKPDFSVDDDDAEVNTEHTFEFIEDPECVAKEHHIRTYRLDEVTNDRVNELHSRYLPSVNGNYGIGLPKPVGVPNDQDLFENVVPDVNAEYLPKDPSESFKKYSISRTEGAVDDSGRAFREWFEVVEVPSYNDEPLKILPYVIID